ncbi:MAG: flagellar assembly protein FliW [Desulfitobacterium sp.]
MIIMSTRFGELEVTEEQIIHFPYGIPGFLDEKAFVHLPHDEESPFSFLQSAHEPNLSFLLVDPFAFLKGYEFEIEDEMSKEMEISKKNPPHVFVIATVKENVRNMTVNLLAPIIINFKKRLGRQVIIEKREYSIRHKLFSDTQAVAASEGGE